MECPWKAATSYQKPKGVYYQKGQNIEANLILFKSKSTTTATDKDPVKLKPEPASSKNRKRVKLSNLSTCRKSGTLETSVEASASDLTSEETTNNQEEAERIPDQSNDENPSNFI